MPLHCNNCGNTLRKSDRYCKQCGAKSPNENVRTVKCPDCGTFIGNSDFCSNCGSKLTKNLYYVIKESNTKTCSKCSNKNNLDAEFCGNCGKTLPLVSNMELVKCPDCGHLVREDVNFCRFCGRNLNTTKNSFFKRKFRPNETYCQNCGKKVINRNQANYCDDCGTFIPPLTTGYSTTMHPHEEYQLIFINKFIVPLSEHYNENFRKTTLSQYFNITQTQESHIIFLVMNDLIHEDLCIDVIERFKQYLEETKNRKNSKEEILDEITTKLTDSFNNKGISISDLATIEDSYYKTVETPVVQNKHGGLTKGVATLGFGIVGLAATSGVKQTVSTKKVLQKGKYTHRKITFKKDHIVLKTYEDDFHGLNFNSEVNNINKIVFNWEDITSLDDEYYFIFNTGETLKCPIPDTTEWISEGVMRVLGTTDFDENFKTNKIWIGQLESDVNKIFFDLIRNRINECKTKLNSNENSNTSNVNELEKIIKMYQDGLLTDDEFIIMKQNVIGTKCDSENNLNNGLDDSPNFCGNCGAEVVSGSKFCTQCGNQLTL